jgi:hypothetical protein
MTTPQFLAKEAFLRLKKDACLFCSSGLSTARFERRFQVTRGDHYYEHDVDVLGIEYLVSGLDIYHFRFGLDEESRKRLEEKRKELVQSEKERKQQEAVKKQRELEAKLNLPDKEKQIAIKAITDDFLSELHTKEFWGVISPLEERIRRLCHNIWLGDLNLACADDYEAGYIEDHDRLEMRYSFYPAGLKAHKSCWPFQKFIPPAQFSLTLAEFLGTLKKSPLLRGYGSLFNGFPGLREYASRLGIKISAQPYNPADWLEKIKGEKR